MGRSNGVNFNAVGGNVTVHGDITGRDKVVNGPKWFLLEINPDEPLKPHIVFGTTRRDVISMFQHSLIHPDELEISGEPDENGRFYGRSNESHIVVGECKTGCTGLQI